jgi:hypothetical protein
MRRGFVSDRSLCPHPFAMKNKLNNAILTSFMPHLVFTIPYRTHIYGRGQSKGRQREEIFNRRFFFHRME